MVAVSSEYFAWLPRSTAIREVTIDVQGTYAVMFNFPMIPAFRDSTQMPAYVPIFYPVLLFIGFKLAEGFRIPVLWRRAVVGGLIMGVLDAPYIIQGNLPHTVWWTWHDWYLYQFWVGWPLVDLWWHLTWDALIFYLLWRLEPSIEATYRRAAPGPRRWAVTLLAIPPAIAGAVNLAGPFLHLPIVIVTALGGPQWPVVVALVAAYVAVAISVRDHLTGGRLERTTALTTGVYVAGMAIMVVGNLAQERGLPQYVLVQTAALVAVTVAVLLLRRNHPSRGRERPVRSASRWLSRSCRHSPQWEVEIRRRGARAGNGHGVT